MMGYQGREWTGMVVIDSYRMAEPSLQIQEATSLDGDQNDLAEGMKY